MLCLLTAAAYLLVALVPSNSFRQAFRTSRSILSPHKDLTVSYPILYDLKACVESDTIITCMIFSR